MKAMSLIILLYTLISTCIFIFSKAVSMPCGKQLVENCRKLYAWADRKDV